MKKIISTGAQKIEPYDILINLEKSNSKFKTLIYKNKLKVFFQVNK